MNKGLFFHIITTLLYCLLVMYVVQNENTGVGSRVLIVFVLLLFNFACAAVCDTSDYYKQNL